MSNGLTSYACRSLSTPRNLGVVRRKYPGHCPYHITHNVLGGHFSRHGSCTVEPFADGACVHGSHSDQARSTEAMGCSLQVAVGKTLQMPLGFSRRAGSTKLHDGCDKNDQRIQYRVLVVRARVGQEPPKRLPPSPS